MNWTTHNGNGVDAGALTQRRAGVLALGAAVVYVLFLVIVTTLPLKWQMALAGTLASGLALCVVPNPRRWLLGIMAFSLPFAQFDVSFLHRPELPGDFRFNVSLVDLCVSVLLLFKVIHVLANRNQRLRLPAALLWPVMGLLVLGALSLFNAPYVGLGFVEWFRLLKMAALAGVVIAVVDDRGDLKTMLSFFIAGMASESLLGIYQHINGGTLGLGLLGENAEMMAFASFSRVGGTLGHPNRLAMYLAMALPVALAAVVFGRNRWLRLGAGVAFVVGVTALILTLSRAGWLGLMVSVSVVLGLYFVKSERKTQVVKVTLLCAVLVAVAAGFFWETIESRLTLDDAGSAESRLIVAEIALDVIREHPFLGGGLGNYVLYLPVYVVPHTLFQEVAKVHNLYLLLAAEMGVFAVVMFWVLLGNTVVRALRKVRRARGLVLVSLVGAVAGLSSFALHGLVDYVDLGRWPIFWFTVALVFVCEKLMKRHPDA